MCCSLSPTEESVWRRLPSLDQLPEGSLPEDQFFYKQACSQERENEDPSRKRTVEELGN